MAQREDFEIYEFIRNGHQWYGFKVDYIGVYSAPSKEQILEIRKKVKKQVKEKLDWIEKENQKYYARLAEEEEKRASLLHEAKEIEREVIRTLSAGPNNLSKEEKQQRVELIHQLVYLGLSNEDIQALTNAPMQSIARVRHWEDKKNSGSRGERM